MSDVVNINTWDPMLITKPSDKSSKEVVTHTEWNEVLTLLFGQGNYQNNTLVSVCARLITLKAEIDNIIRGGLSEGIIETSFIADEAVTEEKLADAAVTNAKIKNATIALAKLTDEVKNYFIQAAAGGTLTGTLLSNVTNDRQFGIGTLGNFSMSTTGLVMLAANAYFDGAAYKYSATTTNSGATGFVVSLQDRAIYTFTMGAIATTAGVTFAPVLTEILHQGNFLPVSATGDNIAVFDTNQKKLKDSQINLTYILKRCITRDITGRVLMELLTSNNNSVANTINSTDFSDNYYPTPYKSLTINRTNLFFLTIACNYSYVTARGGCYALVKIVLRETGGVVTQWTSPTDTLLAHILSFDVDLQGYPTNCTFDLYLGIKTYSVGFNQAITNTTFEIHANRSLI